jgi:3-oxoacyl-[acyl-carrier-protein] synthase-1
LLSDETYRGDGLDAAFKQALSEHAGEGIHTIYASMNGENYWAKEFGVAYLRNKPLPRATVVFPRISKRCVRELNVSCD